MRPQTLFSEKVYNYIHTEGQLDWFQLLRWHTSGDILVANKTENIERHGNEEPISTIYPESGENATDQREKSTVCLANINSDSPHHHHLHHHRAKQQALGSGGGGRQEVSFSNAALPGHIWPRLSWKSLCVPLCCSLTRPKSLGCWSCVLDSSNHIHSACSALDALDEHYKFVKWMSNACWSLMRAGVKAGEKTWTVDLKVASPLSNQDSGKAAAPLSSVTGCSDCETDLSWLDSFLSTASLTWPISSWPSQKGHTRYMITSSRKFRHLPSSLLPSFLSFSLLFSTLKSRK